MKKIFTLFIFLFALVIEANAQITFQKSIGGNNDDVGYCVQQTSDGGYIICGFTESFGSGARDAYLIKTDSIGNTIWTKTYGGTAYEMAYSVKQTNDGGFIFVGETGGLVTASNKDVFLVKTNILGDTLWTKTFGGNLADVGSSVLQTKDGGYFITGYTLSFGSGGGQNMLIIKTDSIGSMIWSKTIENNFALSSADKTSDGGYVIAGTTGFGSGNSSVYLVKIDSIGTFLWAKTFGGSDVNYGYSVEQTKDGGFIIAGIRNDAGPVGDQNVYLVRTDTIGNLLWSKTFDKGNYLNEKWCVQQTADSGVILAGSFYDSFLNEHGVYLIKTNINGDTLWTKTFGQIGTDAGNYVHQTSDGGYIITGSTKGAIFGYYNVYLIKTDNLGNSGCNEDNPHAYNYSPFSTVTIPFPIIDSLNNITTAFSTSIGNGGTVTTICSSVNVNENEKTEPAFNISPNPATDKITISNFQFSISNIEIYNVLGEKVFSQKPTTSSRQQITIDVSNWNKGIYFVKMSDGEKQYAQKVIIQ